MTDFLYDRMSRRMRRAVLGTLVLLYVSVVGAAFYAIIHFVLKFW